MGGVIGVGIAALGVDGVNWGWKGVSQVFAAWAIAPGVAGCFAAIIFLITKYAVLRRKNPVFWAFVSVPIYFAFTTGILTSRLPSHYKISKMLILNSAYCMEGGRISKQGR